MHIFILLNNNKKITFKQIYHVKNTKNFTGSFMFGNGNLTSGMTSVSVYFDLHDDIDKVKLRLAHETYDDVTIDIDGFDVITHDFVNLKPETVYDVIIETEENGHFYSEKIDGIMTGYYFFNRLDDVIVTVFIINKN